MVYLASGGFWLSVKTGVIILASLSVSVAFANLLPQETYGEYKYIFSMFGLLAIPTLMGMGQSITRSVAQGYDGTPLAALKIKMLWGTLGGLASAAIALYYLTQGNTTLAGGFGLMAIFIPFVDTLGVFNSTLAGKKLFKVSAFYESIIQIVSAVVMVGTLFLTDDLILILASYFLSHTITRLIVFQIVAHKYSENREVDQSAIAYGKHLSAMDVMSIVSNTLDTILLWQFVGAAPVAVYAFAKGIPSQISVALQRINALAFPKFAQRDFASIKHALVQKMLLLFGVMIGVVAAYIVAAPYLFSILFPQYMDSVLYSQIFALTLLFFPQKFIGTAFQAHARIKALYISNTVVPVARIVLALVLIPLFGIPGALAVELISRAINFSVLSILLIKTKV